MTPIDCPFRCFDTIIAEYAANTAYGDRFPNIPIVVDFHAESAQEKEALAYYLDGRASIVAGTHTHVQTADERLLPKGTAFISDLGMTGATNGVIGMDKDICIKRTTSQIAHHMECARAEEEDCTLQGIVVEIDGNGKTLNIIRIPEKNYP
jgi:calcineurin-like phosphoesterase